LFTAYEPKPEPKWVPFVQHPRGKPAALSNPGRPGPVRNRREAQMALLEGWSERVVIRFEVRSRILVHIASPKKAYVT
jgi:hypothetical protein